MAITGYKGQGTLLKIEDRGDPGTYITVPFTGTITLPAQLRTMFDTTTTDTAGGYKTQEPGLRDSGVVSSTVSYAADNAVHAMLDTNFEDDTIDNWKIVFTQTALNETYSFAGHITKFGGGTAPVDALTTRMLEVTISGAVTHTNDA